MLEIIIRSSTKNRGGNSPLVQTEVEISNMEVDGIDHVSLFLFCWFVAFIVCGILSTVLTQCARIITSDRAPSCSTLTLRIL